MLRPMTAGDLPAVGAVAAVVHPDFPESAAVFAERLALYPQGCLVAEREGAVMAYVLSHPWQAQAVPALDSLLGALPGRGAVFYIHDLALLPALRGSGVAGALVARLMAHAVAAGFREAALVAVNGSAGFWRRQGFRERDVPALAAKLASYDDAARYMVRGLAPDQHVNEGG